MRRTKRSDMDRYVPVALRSGKALRFRYWVQDASEGVLGYRLMAPDAAPAYYRGPVEHLRRLLQRHNPQHPVSLRAGPRP